MSSTRIAIATICLGLACALVRPDVAGATPAGDCASAKRRATGKRVQGALNCWSLAAKKQKPVDPLCLARAEAKFLIAFARAERGEGCLTIGDADAIGAGVDAYVAAVVAALPDSGAPAPTPTNGPPNSTPTQPATTHTTGPSPTPTPTPTPTSTPGACTNVLGYCWHLSSSDESCSETCSRVGSTYNVATEDVAGSGGPYASCQAVMNALGFSGGGLGSAACNSLTGVGCAGGNLNGSLDYLQCALPTTTADAAQAGLQRACACGSGPTPTPTPTPFSCPAGGVWVDGACWSLGDNEAGCDATCAGLGLAYDPATATQAGSGGGYESCQAVANALGFAGDGSGPIPCDSVGGLGCAVLLALQDGPDYVQCVSPPTTSNAAFIAAQRFCACTANPTSPSKLVFVTSEFWSRNSSPGVEGADQYCAFRAAQAGLSGVFKAWLSAAGLGNSAAERLTHSTVPYVLPGLGTTIANDWNDLTDGTLDHAINVNEWGAVLDFSQVVFTATNSDGTYAGSDCEGWETSQVYGDVVVGETASSDAQWTHRGNIFTCDRNGSLYCLEQ